MITKRHCFLVSLALLLAIGLMYQGNSQPRSGMQSQRGNSQPFNAHSVPGGSSQPTYRVPVSPVAPAPGIAQPAPRVIPWSRIVSLQLAINYYRPLTLAFIEFMRRPAYYYGRYVSWKGIVIGDQAERYFVNVPNESAFYFKVVNPNYRSKTWVKNQTVTVIGVVNRTDDLPTRLGIHKHIPNVQAYYVE